jgi:CheY-like chemotaxis protein
MKPQPLTETPTKATRPKRTRRETLIETPVESSRDRSRKRGRDLPAFNMGFLTSLPEKKMPRETGFKDLRVLIVGGKPNAVRVLRTALSLAGIHTVIPAPDAASGLHHLSGRQFDAVFCDKAVEQLDGRPFVVAARRSPGMKHPAIPIYMIGHDVFRSDVEAARDLGFTDVLVRPITAATIMRKLQLALVQPRAYVEAGDFSGPDRRGKRRQTFRGKERRKPKPVAALPAPVREDIVEL